MANEQIDEHLAKIVTDISALSEKIAVKKKDLWDRLSALSPFIGGVLVAGVGLIFTLTFQKRQIEINEADLAVKFFPFITHQDSGTRAQTYSVIQAVGGGLLITKLAPIGGKAVEPALIAAQSETNDPTTKQNAEQALQKVNAVASLQTKIGFPADGIVGPQTRQAIAALQASKGRNATGNIDAVTVRLISIYDPLFDKAVSDAQTKTNALLFKLQDSKSPLRKYADAKRSYEELLNDINSLKTRAQANNIGNLNEFTMKQIDLLDDSIRKLQAYHVETPNGPSVVVLRASKDLFDVQFESILKLEIAKKR